MSVRWKRRKQPMAASEEGLSKLVCGIVLLSAVSAVAASAASNEAENDILESDRRRQLRRDPLYPTYSPTAPWPTWAPTHSEDGGDLPPAPQVPAAPPSDNYPPTMEGSGSEENPSVSPVPPAPTHEPPSYGSFPGYAYEPPSHGYNTPPGYAFDSPPSYSQAGHHDISHHRYGNQWSARYHKSEKAPLQSNSNWSWNGSNWSWNWNSGYYGNSSNKVGKTAKLGGKDEANHKWWNGWHNPANHWQHGSTNSWYHNQWSVGGNYYKGAKSGKGSKAEDYMFSYWQHGSKNSWYHNQWNVGGGKYYKDTKSGKDAKSGKGSKAEDYVFSYKPVHWAPPTTHFEGLNIHGSKWRGKSSPPKRTSWGWIAISKSSKSTKSSKSKSAKIQSAKGGGWGKIPIHPPTTMSPSSSVRPSVPKPTSVPTIAPNQGVFPTATPTTKEVPSSSPTSHYPTYNPTPTATTTPPITSSPTGAPITPTMKPTPNLTESPTSPPTFSSSEFPSASALPTANLTSSPSMAATNFSTTYPTAFPTGNMTNMTYMPSSSPTLNVTAVPSTFPTEMPIVIPFPRLQQILYPEVASESSFFGSSVAVERNTLAVGVQGDNQGIGSVRVYVSTNNEDFEFQSLLRPNDGIANDDFGRAVAMSGNFIIVGAQRHDAEGENSGAAYIYERTVDEDGDVQWSQVAKLTPPEPQADERFGISVSIQGKVAIVGANGDDTNGENSGAAYLFTLEPNIVGVEQWKFTKKLLAADGAAGDNFGFSVAIYGNQAVVGAVWANERGGSAYVFINQGGTWTTQGKFEGEKADDQFGWSVSMYEETIAVGAIKFDDRTTGPLTREIRDRGSVNIYVKDENGSWYKEARLEPTDGKEGDHFGRSIDLHEDWLIVSAPFNDEMGVDAGTAYIYQREPSMLDGWVLQAKVLPTEEAPALTEFGFSVGVSSENFVVSSKYSNPETELLGNAYIYSSRNPGEPTASPTISHLPTVPPIITSSPTVTLTQSPSKAPTAAPTTPPDTTAPTGAPTELATTMTPSNFPSSAPTIRQSEAPSTVPSVKATTFPSFAPSNAPSGQPSAIQPLPTAPTYPPTIPKGAEPSTKPSVGDETKMPTYRPTPGATGASKAPSPSTNATAAPTPFGDSTEAPVTTNTTRIPTYGPTTFPG